MSIDFNSNAAETFTDPDGLAVQMLDSVVDPISVKNDRMQFIFVNQAFCAFYNKKREEFLGKVLPEIMHDEYTEPAWKQDKEVLETGAERSCQCKSVDADGKSRLLTDRKIRLMDRTGRRYIFCILKEMPETPVVSSQKQPFTAKSGSPISREVIHDLNNSLNIVRGYSELLMEDLMADDPMRKDLEAIYEAGRKAADIAAKF